MIRKEYEIPIYGIKLILCQLSFDDDKETIDKIRTEYDLPEETLSEDDVEMLANGLSNHLYNAGLACRDFTHGKFIVLLSPAANGEERECLYAHEKRHVEDRIMEYYRVDDIESAALLAGYLARIFYRFKQSVDAIPKKVKGESETDKDLC